jgi:hypothetical protein
MIVKSTITMNCAKVTRANTIDRCETLTLVVVGEFDFLSSKLASVVLIVYVYLYVADLFTDKVFFATNCSNENFLARWRLKSLYYVRD